MGIFSLTPGPQPPLICRSRHTINLFKVLSRISYLPFDFTLKSGSFFLFLPLKTSAKCFSRAKRLGLLAPAISRNRVSYLSNPFAKLGIFLELPTLFREITQIKIFTNFSPVYLRQTTNTLSYG